MLAKYKYIKGDTDELQKELTKLFKRLRRQPLKKRFLVKSWCSGTLLDRAQSSKTLKKHLRNFYHAYVGLTDSERHQVQKAFLYTNRVSLQLANKTAHYSFTSLPKNIQSETKYLFSYLYTYALKAKGECRDHWRAFYKELPDKICPFCGIEHLHHPEHYKQDYDHLLCQKTYPFASVNMRNIAPMGRDCNTIYKNQTDAIFDGKVFRQFPNPFGKSNIAELDLSGSTRPNGNANPGSWNISFNPNSDDVLRWNEVFDLSRRYEDEFLSLYYSKWIDEFLGWALGKNNGQQWTESLVLNTLKSYNESLKKAPLYQHNFLKSALVELIINENKGSFMRSCVRQLS